MLSTIGLYVNLFIEDFQVNVRASESHQKRNIYKPVIPYIVTGELHNMMPTITYELRKLYSQQKKYSAKKEEGNYKQPPLLQWPENGYFTKIKPDADLLQQALTSFHKYPTNQLSERVFGSELKRHTLELKHGANLFYERCRFHKNHLEEIDYRHAKVQEKIFWLEENVNHPDRLRRMTNLQGQLLQLEQQRREEELSFWKDTVELRKDLFESASEYRNTRHRHNLFSEVEKKYG